MELNVPIVLQPILEEYVLPMDGDHGIAHWARVLENGLRLAQETGADTEVVQLFAILHDARRISEGTDPNHGPRAAALAVKQRLVPSVKELRDAFDSKAQSWANVVKIGRTHLQDATPLTLGQEISGYVGMLADGLERLELVA